eukprot:CAMPEP_0168726638 /NCGR_PEP_ID=MMETSP0724-20121128/4770_1 /TAXON_ID=265536 /ORGANISM="Amphiprora sp., Strain CCMP467" /LENGTH=264 /DNA_ID=CAMNT_0008773455 /DNA_START=118 /DNA_END=912 /DNA_ORIENTATION=-
MAGTEFGRHERRKQNHCMIFPSSSPLKNGKGGSCLDSPAHFQIRTFAKGKKKAALPSAKPLSNEELIAQIMKKSGSDSPNNCSVRMVVEELQEREQQNESNKSSGSKKMQSKVSIVPLSTAIQTAVEKELDLVEISMDQDVPVIKVVKLSAVIYRSERNKRSGNKAGSALAEKEFQFKVQIADNDLARKLSQMTSFLDKGHRCAVRVRCPHWIARDDEETLERFLKRLKKEVEESDAKTTSSKIDMNEQRTVGKLYFERKVKKM